MEFVVLAFVATLLLSAVGALFFAPGWTVKRRVCAVAIATALAAFFTYLPARHAHLNERGSVRHEAWCDELQSIRDAMLADQLLLLGQMSGGAAALRNDRIPIEERADAARKILENTHLLCNTHFMVCAGMNEEASDTIKALLGQLISYQQQLRLAVEANDWDAASALTSGVSIQLPTIVKQISEQTLISIDSLKRLEHTAFHNDRASWRPRFDEDTLRTRTHGILTGK